MILRSRSRKTQTPLTRKRTREKEKDYDAHARKEAEMDHELYRLLVESFGWGENKVQRVKLYQRLASLAKRMDAGCKAIILDMVQEAKGKDRPERYFCFSVLWRLEELGYIAERKDKRRQMAQQRKDLEGYKRTLGRGFEMPDQ